jgi:hypothetical protein
MFYEAARTDLPPFFISFAHAERCCFVPTAGVSRDDSSCGTVTAISCFFFQPSGASLHKCSCSFHFPRLREEYSFVIQRRPYRRMYCLCLGGIWAVTRAIKSKTSKLLKFSLKKSLYLGVLNRTLP